MKNVAKSVAKVQRRKKDKAMKRKQKRRKEFYLKIKREDGYSE